MGALLGVVADSAVADDEIDAFIERFNAEFAVAAAEAGETGPEPEAVEVGGRKIVYLRMGEGPPLVLIHGFGGDLNNWLFNQPALAESATIYALDLPGHGASAKEVGSADMAMLSETLHGFLDALEIERAHLAGHSMGGALSLVYALGNPDRVAGLTLIAPGGLGPEVNMAYIDGFIEAGKRKAMKAALEMLVADPALISRDMVNDVLKYKRLDGVEAALKALAGNLFAGGRQESIADAALSSLSMPVQVIWGREDQVVPAAHAENVPAGFNVHLFDKVGHMPHMEAAAEVNRLILDQLG